MFAAFNHPGTFEFYVCLLGNVVHDHVCIDRKSTHIPPVHQVTMHMSFWGVSYCCATAAEAADEYEKIKR